MFLGLDIKGEFGSGFDGLYGCLVYSMLDEYTDMKSTIL